MSEIDELINDINKLRENLQQLISLKKENLLDEEIITASRVLNDAITKYNNIIINSMKK